jgi:hypothetical protein
MEETVNTLIDLDTVEVSLVDKGANQRVFAIRKAEQMNDIIKDIIDVPLEQETEVVEALVSKELTDDARHGLIGAMRIVQAYKDETGMREALVALATLLDFEKPEQVEENPMAQEDVAMEKSSEDSINMNDIPDEVRAQVENLWKANGEEKKFSKLSAMSVSPKSLLQKLLRTMGISQVTQQTSLVLWSSHSTLMTRKQLRRSKVFSRLLAKSLRRANSSLRRV